MPSGFRRCREGREKHHLRPLDQLQLGQRHDAALSSERWKVKSEPASVLVVVSLDIIRGGLDASALTQAKFFDQQFIEGQDAVNFDLMSRSVASSASREPAEGNCQSRRSLQSVI
ncbi:hypothetical protein [Pseudaminobacter sp. NGMCC 1.201702]|uniref:hypothetical protein n=1 Tax=Pseudaminobacter sp. NGMCC 1.201702 TaxID=3391825 RepID=UPI0039EED8B9